MSTVHPALLLSNSSLKIIAMLPPELQFMPEGGLNGVANVKGPVHVLVAEPQSA